MLVLLRCYPDSATPHSTGVACFFEAFFVVPFEDMVIFHLDLVDIPLTAIASVLRPVVSAANKANALALRNDDNTLALQKPEGLH
jgi:hypothetical protein